MIGFFNKKCFILTKNIELKDYEKNKFYLLEDEFITLFCSAFGIKDNKLIKLNKGKIKIDFDKLIITSILDEDKFKNLYIYMDDEFIFFNFLISKERFECKEFETKVEDIKKANEYIENITQDMKLLTVFNELFLNAYEHGNLGLSFKQKADLIKKGKYLEYVKNNENSKKILVCSSKILYKNQKFIAIKIKDEGEGFKLENKESVVSGRGIKISSKYAYIFYNRQGNEVLIIRKINEF